MCLATDIDATTIVGFKQSHPCIRTQLHDIRQRENITSRIVLTTTSAVQQLIYIVLTQPRVQVCASRLQPQLTHVSNIFIPRV